MMQETTSKTPSNDVDRVTEEKTLDRRAQEDAFTNEGAPPAASHPLGIAIDSYTNPYVSRRRINEEERR
jgi:hypothetical protein